MKLAVLQKDLSKCLSLASRFVSSRAQLPVLANVLLSAEKAKLVVSATNLEISLTTSIGAKVVSGGKITVPAKIISELISNLSSDTLTLESQKESFKIEGQNFSSTLSAMNASDFPVIPQKMGSPALSLPSEKFSKALSQVLFAASTDDTRPVLTGVLFIFGNSSLTIVASDGFRLSQKKVVLGKGTTGNQVIIPRSALSEVLRIQKDSGESIVFHQKKKESQVMFGMGESVLTSRVIEGEFPDFEKIIPQSSAVKVLVDKDDFFRAIKTSSVFAREAANIVKLKVEKNSLRVAAESSKSGKQKLNLDAKVEGDSVEISYNYRFLEEFLATVEGDSVEISLVDSSSPGVFKNSKDPDFLHLIMPVRVQG